MNGTRGRNSWLHCLSGVARAASCLSALAASGLAAQPAENPAPESHRRGITPAPFSWRTNMNRSELEATARAMVAPGRGILAADESTGTIKKRFDAIKVENTEENRRAYRELLFTAPGIAEHISGVIMYDETLRQKTRAGVPFPELLAKQGIVPGIKVDAGAKPLAGGRGTGSTPGSGRA